MNTAYQFNANTGVTSISTANTNLDGTGAMSLVITGALATGTSIGGTILRSVTIKATQATTRGMVRLFTSDGITKFLYKEIVIPAVTPSGILPAYSITIPLNITLQPNDELWASTQNAESFNIIVDGLDYGSCACSAEACDCSNMQYGSNTGLGTISQANSNLDGSGATVSIFTSPSLLGNGGSMINLITVKAAQDTTQGMVRIFINYVLFYEIPIPPSTTSGGILPSFTIALPTGFNLQGGYELRASTESAEAFNIIVDGTNFQNCACN